MAGPSSIRPVLHQGLQTVRIRDVQRPGRRAAKVRGQINRWLAKGKLKPRIDRVMKLSEAAAAHQLQEDNTLRRAGTLAGKIVLAP